MRIFRGEYIVRDVQSDLDWLDSVVDTLQREELVRLVKVFSTHRRETRELAGVCVIDGLAFERVDGKLRPLRG